MFSAINLIINVNANYNIYVCKIRFFLSKWCISVFHHHVLYYYKFNIIQKVMLKLTDGTSMNYL